MKSRRENSKRIEGILVSTWTLYSSYLSDLKHNDTNFSTLKAHALN